MNKTDRNAFLQTLTQKLTNQEYIKLTEMFQALENTNTNLRRKNTALQEEIKKLKTK